MKQINVAFVNSIFCDTNRDNSIIINKLNGEAFQLSIGNANNECHPFNVIRRPINNRLNLCLQLTWTRSHLFKYTSAKGPIKYSMMVFADWIGRSRAIRI